MHLQVCQWLIFNGDKIYIDELVRALKVFNEASSREINWENLCAYWFDKFTHKVLWLANHTWKQMEEGDLSKFLGTMFGLNLNVTNVDHFLFSKLSKILEYWSTMKLSVVGRVVIWQSRPFVHSLVLHHSFGGSNKILMKSRGAIRNYMWSSKERLNCT